MDKFRGVFKDAITAIEVMEPCPPLSRILKILAHLAPYRMKRDWVTSA